MLIYTLTTDSAGSTKFPEDCSPCGFGDRGVSGFGGGRVKEAKGLGGGEAKIRVGCKRVRLGLALIHKINRHWCSSQRIGHQTLAEFN